MKAKNILLVSGVEDSINWLVKVVVTKDEKFKTKEQIVILDNRQYYQEHRKKKLEESNEVYRKNRESILQKKHELYWESEEEREKHSKRARHWRENNLERKNAYKRGWTKTRNGKLSLLKDRAARRKLGFKPLNAPFENSAGHHINEKEVIFIPKELHISISHNLSTGKNMFEINMNAFQFLKDQLGVDI